MDTLKNNRILITIYIVFLLATVYFVGFLMFEEAMDECEVEALTTRYVGGSGTGKI
jgi:hypothetical protein